MAAAAAPAALRALAGHVAAWPAASRRRQGGCRPAGRGQAASSDARPAGVAPAGGVLVGLPGGGRPAVAQQAQRWGIASGQRGHCPHACFALLLCLFAFCLSYRNNTYDTDPSLQLYSANNELAFHFPPSLLHGTKPSRGVPSPTICPPASSLFYLPHLSSLHPAPSLHISVQCISSCF